MKLSEMPTSDERRSAPHLADGDQLWGWPSRSLLSDGDRIVLMTDVDRHLQIAISRVPLLSVIDCTPQRLAGLTNVNYRIGDYVLRVPGDGTSEYIDRRSEEVSARSAAAAGVNAEVMFFDATDGLMVTRFVDGAATMSPQRFTDLDAVARAAKAFHRLHTTAAPFATEFRLFPMIDEYKALLAAKGAMLPDGYDDVQRQAESLRNALEASPAALVPSHCDPLCENFLDTGERMFVIDYEYAGNNDPMWDLGDLSVEAGFSAEQDDALLRAYFAVDAVGRHSTRQRQPCRRLLGLRGGPLRTLPTTDGHRRIRQTDSDDFRQLTIT
jgi:thiamine kinase-like enzyme